MDESKLAPSLLARLQEPRALEAAVPPVPVIVQYRSDVIRTQRVRPGIRARYVYRLTPTVAAVAPGKDVLELTDDDTVAFIWLDEEVHTCLDQSLPHVGVSAVWSAGYRGTGIKMAILDTGLDTSHPDFAGRVVNGVSFVGGDHRDENGHGTHVAGIAAGDGASQGAQYRGVAPDSPGRSPRAPERAQGTSRLLSLPTRGA